MTPLALLALKCTFVVMVLRIIGGVIKEDLENPWEPFPDWFYVAMNFSLYVIFAGFGMIVGALIWQV